MKFPLKVASAFLVLAILPGVVSIGAAPRAEAAAPSRCIATTPRTISTGGTAWVPAASVGGTTNCYLEYDTAAYNPATYRLQESLRSAEGQYYVAVDGYYGSVTRRAVVNIQNRYGLTTDGVYGPNTGRAMRWLASNGTAGWWI